MLNNEKNKIIIKRRMEKRIRCKLDFRILLLNISLKIFIHRYFVLIIVIREFPRLLYAATLFIRKKKN